MFPQLIHWIVTYPGDNDIQLVTFERLGPVGLINSFCPF